jgi:hypothetical protein
MKKLILMLAAGSLILFNSCTRTGPQGPAGPQGAQGNANVLGSNPFTVNSWAYSTSEVAYVATFNDADITTAVADRGVVEIYLLYPDGTWRALPDVVNGTQFFFRFSAGGFDIYYANVDGSTPSFPPTATFRTVVISPSQRQANPNTNWKNYNQVMKVVNETQVSPVQ